jgi:hypothetical protein
MEKRDAKSSEGLSQTEFPFLIGKSLFPMQRRIGN